MNRNRNSKIEIIDRWFKVKIIARRPREDEDEVDYSYTTGLTSETVRVDVQKSLGPGYIVSAEPIEYSKLIKEISCRSPNLQLM